MNRILLSAVYLCLSHAVMAQNIVGKVIDENNEPMDYVNVVLLNRVDSTYIAGTVTQKDGSFLFENQYDSSAFVRLLSVGYATQSQEIPPTGNLGIIAMLPESIMLGEVVVKSNLPSTAIKGNALVTTIANSVLAHAGTANDVLAQVPMVLGRDGNFEVFGKGAPLIYINGRKIQDLNELSQLNSADIRNVEVITNPGAKYDASVKSVIRIRTNRPQGDGLSGTLRSQNGFRHYFVTTDQANLKLRTGGLELFGNFGYMGGRFQDHKVNNMLTQSSVLWDQLLENNGFMRTNEFYGKFGFSYMFNDHHSIGAYYSNGFTKAREQYTGYSRILADNSYYDELRANGCNKTNSYPKHHTNIYYNGSVGDLGLDVNVDYMWKKNRINMLNDEASDNFDNTIVNSLSAGRSRLIAEKLVLSYPFWKGEIELGEEFTSSHFENIYSTDATQVKNTSSQVDEKNISGFFQIMQRFGMLNVEAGLRYEHVKFDYFENGEVKADQSKSYKNFFPSLSVSTMIDKLQMSLSYTHKTQRPSYAALDGTIDYINRFTLESGNPYLKPEKLHSVELMGAWKQFFGQVSYLYKKDPILNTTHPYGDDGEIKLITKDNVPRIQQLQAFVGGQFRLGIWQPKINVGFIKQRLTIDYSNGRKSLEKPLALVQFQNAIHLPGDIWLNADMQWMSAGNDENTYLKSTSYLNAKLYKAFCNNRFSVTLEANDIFNKNNRDFTFYNKDVTIYQNNKSDNRSFMVTLQYNFNSTRDRYKGQGAGQSEKERF